MKKTIAALALCLLLGCARAEIVFYTLNNDVYYHNNPVCGGAQGMVPLSETAAKEFHKYRCPVCGPTKQDIPAQSLVRGGTIVCCIPQSWLDDPGKIAGVFYDFSETTHEGGEAYARLSEYLHGEFYTGFMEEYHINGAAQTTVRVPNIVWQQGELVMNRRHFGGVYYIVVRPKIGFEDSYSTPVQFFEHDLSMENGVLREYVGREWHDSEFEISLTRINGGKTIHEGDNDGLQISIFHEMNVNIAVITEQNADPSRIDGLAFTIDGRHTGIELSGYMDGQDAVYCCVLTDAELDMIRNGAKIGVSRENTR